MTVVSGLVETQFEAQKWVEGSNHSAMDMVLWLERIQENLQAWQLRIYRIEPATGALEVFGVDGSPTKNPRGLEHKWITVKANDWIARIGDTTYVISEEEFNESYMEVFRG